MQDVQNLFPDVAKELALGRAHILPSSAVTYAIEASKAVSATATHFGQNST